MDIKSDIEIAAANEMKHISEIGKSLGLTEDSLEMYGKYKAKININEIKNKKENGKLILVTAISPTKAGEGKTTTAIGLADALSSIGEKSILTLREPSLGPVFGLKGGATGGGFSQVVPMEDINLHFTGDFHAITSANNLLAAMLDNHIFQGNQLNIDIDSICFKRVVDMNDRQLRYIKCGLGGAKSGIERSSGFDITVASEVMAVFCLSETIDQLKENLANIIVAYNGKGEPIKVKDIKAQGAMTALLKEAIKPNLVQTLEHTPAIIHGGPFANIAHGCNSLIATKTAMKLADYVITEAGFGADLGAEKFVNIKCRKSGLTPSAVVIVATVRALKMHGESNDNEMRTESLDALEKGIRNLEKHIENITVKFNLPAVVAINKFASDSADEIKMIENKCNQLGVQVVLSDVFSEGGKGGESLAREVVKLCNEKNQEMKFTYTDQMSIEEKILAVVKEIYGGVGTDLSEIASEKINKLEKTDMRTLPICIAKTPYSFTGSNEETGLIKDFTIEINDVKVASGAGFIIVYVGNVMTMPGLPKKPAAENIDISSTGEISGLF